MHFSTIFTVLAAGAMAFAGAVPASGPVAIAKRSNTDIKNAFNDLSDKCDAIFPKYSGCTDDTCSALLAAEIVVAVSECTTVLGGLTGGLGTLTVANAVVEAVTVSVGQLPEFHSTHTAFQKISVGLDTHKTQCGSGCPGLIDIYADVDLSLSVCLQAVFGLCFGLLALVTVLWVLDVHLPSSSIADPIYRLVGLLATLQEICLTLVISVCLL